MKLSLSERLLWSAALLATGACLPGALLYWVASHGLRFSPTVTFSTLEDYYARPFDTVVWAAIWHFPPFFLLAVICLVASRGASRRWLALMALVGVIFISAPLVPSSIHTFKSTYRRKNSGEGAEFNHFFAGILSCVSVSFGLRMLFVFHHRLPATQEVRNV